MQSTCLECQTIFVVPHGSTGKFCCQSHAASYNNRKHPKRIKRKEWCSGCRLPIEPHRKWCDKCLPKVFGDNATRLHATHPEIPEKLNLAYRKDELEIKAILERKYHTVFHKEKVGGRYVDFADHSTLIEYTKDGGHGLHDVIARFADVKKSGDKRKRIAFVDTRLLGRLRSARLQDLAVEVFDCKVLRGL